MHDPTRHKLQERVKELTALHRTARLLQDTARPERDVVRDIVALLPPAWQYPDVAAARITFGEICEATPGFAASPWTQSARFATRHEQGVIEVAYTAERPAEVEGPFLAEERELIESLADMLGSYFQHKQADRDIENAYADLERLVAERTADLAEEVRRHEQARQKIEEYQARLRQLTTELTLTEERGRREIAVDLHDHTIQEFAFIRLRLLQFRGDAVFYGFERNLDEILTLLEGAIRHMRELTFEISTPILYELGLPAALEWLSERYEKRHGLPIQLALERFTRPLPEAVRVTLFKCAQELLTNVVKYAGAARVTLELTPDAGGLRLIVSDDGAGFDVAALEAAGPHGGFGLFSIRERLRYFGGSMTVKSSPAAGTQVTLSVPWED